MVERAEASAQIARWLEEVVIGLNLCPFAAAPWRRGLVRIVVSDATSFEDALADAMDEVEWLLDSGDVGDEESDPLSTTLIAYTHALGGFEEFLEAARALEEVLRQEELEGVFQVATFHPDYRFAGVDPDDPGNRTNRAPYPILHLLREEEVSEAIARHPDAAGIPARNIALMRSLAGEG
jgi:uncharacterized protein